MTTREKQLATLILKERLESLTGKRVILKEGLKEVSLEQMNSLLQRAGKEVSVVLNMVTPVKVNKFYINDEGEKERNPAYDENEDNSYKSKLRKINTVEGTINFDYYEVLYRKILEKTSLKNHLENVLGIDTNIKEDVIEWYLSTRKPGYKAPVTVREGAIQLSDKGEYYLSLLDPQSAYNYKETTYLLDGEEYSFEEIRKYLPPAGKAKKEVIVDELEPPRINMQKPLLKNVTAIVLGNTEYKVEGTTKEG